MVRGVAVSLSREAWAVVYEGRRWVSFGMADVLGEVPPLPLELPRAERFLLDHFASLGVPSDHFASLVGLPNSSRRPTSVGAPAAPLRRTPFYFPSPDSAEALLEPFENVTVLGEALAGPLQVWSGLQDLALPAQDVRAVLRRSLAQHLASRHAACAAPRVLLFARFSPAAPALDYPPWAWLEGIPLRRLAFLPGVGAAFEFLGRGESDVAPAGPTFTLRLEGLALSHVALFLVA